MRRLFEATGRHGVPTGRSRESYRLGAFWEFLMFDNNCKWLIMSCLRFFVLANFWGLLKTFSAKKFGKSEEM